MARSKSDISNAAIRIFLQDVGRFYDKIRDFEVFRPTRDQKLELLSFFGGECCFCGSAITVQTLSQDHLIPLNKAHLGLHAWGNVVPACGACNSKKHNKPWRDHLASLGSGPTLDIRKRKIEEFISLKKYDPNLELGEYALNLYEDVGAVSMALIGLRYKQAEEAIKALLGKDD